MGRSKLQQSRLRICGTRKNFWIPVADLELNDDILDLLIEDDIIKVNRKLQATFLITDVIRIVRIFEEGE
jgi:hypothetical protein